MEYMEISREVDQFVMENFGIDAGQLKGRSLLGPDVGLEPHDLIFLFFELQERFHIQFIEDDILKKEFHILDHIKEAIMEKRPVK